MDDQISIRKDHSSAVRQRAGDLLAKRVNEWSDGTDISKKVCIYTTGSFGRNDASEHSDLDVFIVSLQEEITSERLLSGLEEIELLASIVHVNRELNLPDLDGDGGYLKVHTLSDYLIGLGKPSDDADNTFTGRLLLLLESQPIFGHQTYLQVLTECVERYWVDYSDHSDSFLPAFLVNDILRFWRTLCVNYEAGTSQEPAKRRAKNYKLKYSRLLTCFSAILALQVTFKKAGTISQVDALDLLQRTPLERLSYCKSNLSESLAGKIRNLEEMYDEFLTNTNCSKNELYDKMSDPGYYTKSLRAAREFGDAMYLLLRDISEEDRDDKDSWRFFRYVAI